MFSHEKLSVYQTAKQFLEWRIKLLKTVKRKVAAIDHLVRASESVGLNIAHASGVWGSRERMKYIGCSSGSTVECAAALDILHVKKLIADNDCISGKESLSQILGMLIAWYKQTSTRVEEERASYGTTVKECFFGHESLDVYRASLRFVRELNKIEEIAPCSSDLLGKLDKSSTSIVLNIAEGNGRFVVGEQSRFIQIAHKATVQTSALLDMAHYSVHSAELIVNANQLLSRIAAMLTAWRRSIEE